MPVCKEKTFMDYLAAGCMLFTCISLIETGVVMLIHESLFAIPALCSVWHRELFQGVFLQIKEDCNHKQSIVRADSAIVDFLDCL